MRYLSWHMCYFEDADLAIFIFDCCRDRGFIIKRTKSQAISHHKFLESSNSKISKNVLNFSSCMYS